MYVKRFRGATVSEALALARKELGEDALLLGTGKPADAAAAHLVEVTVAAERPRPMNPSRSRASAAASAAVPRANASGGGPAGPRTSAAMPGELPLVSQASAATAPLSSPGRANLVPMGGSTEVQPRGQVSGDTGIQAQLQMSGDTGVQVRREPPVQEPALPTLVEAASTAPAAVRASGKAAVPLSSFRTGGIGSTAGGEPQVSAPADAAAAALAPPQISSGPVPIAESSSTIEFVARAEAAPLLDAASAVAGVVDVPSGVPVASSEIEPFFTVSPAIVDPTDFGPGVVYAAYSEAPPLQLAPTSLTGQDPNPPVLGAEIESAGAAEMIGIPRGLGALPLTGRAVAVAPIDAASSRADASGPEEFVATSRTATDRAPATYEEQVTDLQARFDLLSRRVARMVKEIRPAENASAADSRFAPPSLADIVARLASTGLDADLCEGAARAALARAETRGIAGDAELMRVLADSLAGVLAAEAPTPAGSRRVLALVGPPGTGKTTTAVKIAALESHVRGRACVLVSADHYRIGAVEQLAEYAALLGVPFERVRAPGELADAIERHTAADLIIIDTAGHAPADSTRMWDLRRLLEGAEGADLLLVLAATTRRRDLAEAISRFRALDKPRIVFTKMDETQAYGELLAEAASSGCPVAAFATGQAVPDDFEDASPARFAELVVRSAWAGRQES